MQCWPGISLYIIGLAWLMGFRHYPTLRPPSRRAGRSRNGGQQLDERWSAAAPLSSRVDRCYRSDTFPVSRNPLAAPQRPKVRSPASNRRRGGRSACSGLFATPLAQPPGRAWRQRLPARYDARTLPRLHVVRDAGKQPAQLDRGRQLALLLECSADCGGFRFGHDEHGGSMVTRGVTGKLPDLSRPLIGTPAPREHPSPTV